MDRPSFSAEEFDRHVMTTYNLLRHAGVDLGKQDYLKGAAL